MAWLTAPVVRFSSAAARVKLWCRAAASNAEIERGEGGRTGIPVPASRTKGEHAIAPLTPSLMKSDQRSSENQAFGLALAGRHTRAMTFRLQGYDHVGIRVSDADRAVAFYVRLGFAIDAEFSNELVVEMVSTDGTRINLIFNGRQRLGANNVLMDEPVNWPGYTHAAFIVDSLQRVLDWASTEQVAITEGPVDWGRRLTCFLRDPDGNVLEFNELVERQEKHPLPSTAANQPGSELTGDAG